MIPLPKQLSKIRAFSLLEILVATAVLAILVVVLASATNAALSTVRRASGKMDQISSARAGFDLLTATLSQATLNTYWDYATNAAGNPEKYVRRSDLHFLIGQGPVAGQSAFFQSPLGRSANANPDGVLNAVGYWVQFGDDSTWKPSHVQASRPRYRLMQGLQPTENLSVFRQSGDAWKNALQNAALPIAENVIAMVLWPRLPAAQDALGTQLSADFLYDSRGGMPVQAAQLPPQVQVVMIVIDEATAARLEAGGTEPDAIREALENRFQEVANFDDDLRQVKEKLDAARISYRVLSAPVTLRESKWSKVP